MKMEFGKTAENRGNDEKFLIVSDSWAVGPRGLEEVSGLILSTSEHTSLEDLLKSWGMSEFEFEFEVQPLLEFFSGKAVPKTKGQRLEEEIEFDWKTWRKRRI